MSAASATTAPARPGPGVTSRSPPRIPAWALPLVRLAWNSGFTPGIAVRGLGPLGPMFARRSAVSRISRMTLETPLSPGLLALLGSYFYHTNGSDGSGEFALRHLLGPGAYAHRPVGVRLSAAAKRPADDPLRLSCRVAFVYGSTHDWMNAGAGDTCAAALVAAGVPARVYRAGPGGHHVYLEAATAVNAILCSEIDSMIGGSSSVSVRVDNAPATT